MTKASLTAMQAMVSTPVAFILSALTTYPGMWVMEQPGVKAPGTANRRTFLPAKISSVLMSLGPSAPMVFNVPAALTGWQAALAGVAGGLAWLFLDNRGQTGPYDRRRLATAIVIYAIVLLLLTFFAPLGFTLADRPVGAILVLVGLGWSTVAAVAGCFADAPWRALRRYKLEEVILRGLKGFG